MQEVTHLLQKENFSRLGHAEKRRVKQRCVRLLIVGDWDDFFRDLMCEPNRVPRAWACPRRRDVFVGIFSKLNIYYYERVNVFLNYFPSSVSSLTHLKKGSKCPAR